MKIYLFDYSNDANAVFATRHAFSSYEAAYDEVRDYIYKYGYNIIDDWNDWNDHIWELQNGMGETFTIGIYSLTVFD